MQVILPKSHLNRFLADAGRRVVYAATLDGNLHALCQCPTCGAHGPGHCGAQLGSTEGDSDAGELNGRDTVLGQASQSPLRMSLWVHRFPKPVFSSPSVNDVTGDVIVGCVDGQVYCVNMSGSVVCTASRHKDCR
jgi:outer membrane protein assembly factor BamB